jgi:hypothetical protein
MQTKQFQRWAKRNPVEAAGLGAVAVLFLLYAPNMLRSIQAQDRLRQFAATQQESIQQSQLIGDQTEERAKIAEARYEKGLKFVVASSNQNQGVALIEGQPVYDPITQMPIANGVVVGDTAGTTGIITDSVVKDVAFTGDTQVVQEAMKKAGFNIMAKTPVIKGKGK